MTAALAGGPTSLALGSSAWESALVGELAARKHQVGAIRRCVDVVELLADAGAGTITAVVVDAAFPRLDATVLSRLRRSNAALIGVTGDEAGERQLRQWGLTRVVAIDSRDPAAAANSIIAELARARSGEDLGDRIGSGDPTQIVEPTAGRGGLVAVWGPAGSPGRTCVAIALAEHAAQSGTDAIAIDLDLQAPGVGDQLGMVGENSGLIAASRHGEQGSLDVAALARSARSVAPGFRVLTGLPHPSRRGELRPAALTQICETSRVLTSLIVADLGSACDYDNSLPSELGMAGPDWVAGAVLAEAEVVVAVTSCEPVAVARFLSAVRDVQELAPQASFHVVLNRVRPGVVDAREVRQMRQLIAEQTGAEFVWVVHDDRDAFDAAAGRD